MFSALDVFCEHLHFVNIYSMVYFFCGVTISARTETVKEQRKFRAKDGG